MIAAVVLAAAAIPAAAGPGGLSAVAVRTDGVCEALEPRRLASPDGLSGVDHVWVWSAAASPRAVEPAAAGRPREADARHLAVRVVLPEGADPAGLVVVAAPTTMWEEVPEDLLPSWPVPAGGRLQVPRGSREAWRVRLRGGGEGSWWVDVAADRDHIAVAPSKARDVAVGVADASGEPVEHASLRLFPDARGRPEGRDVLAAFEVTAPGRFAVPAVPAEAGLVALVMARGHVPSVVRVGAGDSSAAVRLAPGVGVRGRYVTGDGTPLSGVRTAVEFWASPDLAWPIAKGSVSAADGTWAVDGVPVGPVAVSATAAGFAPWKEKVTAGADGADLGTVTMARGLRLPFVVVDDLGAAVSGASVTLDAGPAGVTDARGACTVEGVPSRGATAATVEADGHLPESLSLAPPFPETVRVQLTRAFTITGRLLRPDGTPPLRGEVSVEIGRQFTTRPLLDGGRFRVAAPPGRELALLLRSPETLELRTRVGKGFAGERRDLGDLEAPRGLVVRGTVRSAVDGSPVSGAAVWAPRPSPQGAIVSWMLQDLLKTSTARDGSFEIRGLRPMPALLRIDAPGFARAHLDVSPEPGVSVVEAGEVALVEGATLEIATDKDAGEGAVARADLRGRWLELDMVTAPVTGREATIRHVPEGPVKVTVVRGDEVLCEEDVDVPEGPASVDVTCRMNTVTVKGAVRLGGAPSGPGTLVWASASDPGSNSGGIMNFRSPGGLSQQGAFFSGPPQVRAVVRDDGSFETDALRAGAWDARFHPDAGGSPTPTRRVDVPPTDVFEVTLEYPGMTVRGVVVDGDDRPVADARVRDLDSGGLAFSRQDGVFGIGGLEAGTHHVQARLGARVSDPVAVELRQDREADPVRLVLDEANSERISIRVVDERGAPAAGCLVFLDTGAQGVRVLTADTEGTATADVTKPFPDRVRAAAAASGRWALGPWTAWEQAREGIVLPLGAGGTLVLRSEELEGTPAVRSSSGWDVAWLLSMLGSRPLVSPTAPLVLGGLPEGTYGVTLGSYSGSAVVRRNAAEELELP